MGYVTAFVGPRDFYEVPLALQEGNILSAHIADFYASQGLVNFSRYLGPRISRYIEPRFRPGLPSNKTRCNLSTILRQMIDPHRRRDAIKMAFVMDRALSNQAAAVSENNDCDLFLYSGAAYWAFTKLLDRARLLFQFHPHAASVRALLEHDFAIHPEVQYSYETEYDSIPLRLIPVENLIEWQYATHIVCASTFTSKSLQQQGCPSSKISVVPYGLGGWTEDYRLAAAEKSAICRFLFVGQGIQRKGLHHLLKAWRAADLPDSALTLVCTRIDPGILDLSDQPNVRLQKKLSRGELSTEYRNSDIFVMPSLVEGFGLVYGEALAAGLFCIGTNNTGLRDLNPPDGAALVINAGDVRALTEALIESYDRWRRGGLDKLQISKSCQRHSWQRFRADILQIAQREQARG